MTTIAVQATYTNGLLKLATRLNLPEGVLVEVLVSEPVKTEAVAKGFGALKGILNHLTDDDLDKIEKDLAVARQMAEAIARNAALITIDRQMTASGLVNVVW